MFSHNAVKSAKKLQQNSDLSGVLPKSPEVNTGGSHFKRKTMGNMNPNQLRKLASEHISMSISQTDDNLTQHNAGELKERLRISQRKNNDLKSLLQDQENTNLEMIQSLDKHKEKAERIMEDNQKLGEENEKLRERVEECMLTISEHKNTIESIQTMKS